MRDLGDVGSAGSFSCPCCACEPAPAMSRRQFLCIHGASVGGAIVASPGRARAQQPAVAPGRPILNQKAAACSRLTVRAGDFENADILQSYLAAATQRRVGAYMTDEMDGRSSSRRAFAASRGQGAR
jgi:hypothetical protein